MHLMEKMEGWRLAIAVGFLLYSACGGACAGGATGQAARQPPLTQSAAVDGKDGGNSPMTDSDSDAAYYQGRAVALATEGLDEIRRTDFARFRRGRLYVSGGASADEERSLGDKLTAAFDGNDSAALLDITEKILANDQADIRAHMLRGITLRKVNRSAEGNFHRAVAIGLIDSIVHGGDGRGVRSAWTVYRVKEEYEILKVLGCTLQSQALRHVGNRYYDVLEGSRVDGGGTLQVYFDVTELFGMEQRRRGR